ncbi:ArsR family transcription regulator [Natronomonas pharaonis DSM 2160]|uniref:ArsR family transcription regulator n=1 Tax=Natronomonas pharaonis (strain ATCC 35678 / DSM 2160 / CIP 103997 / JCM 8858 / NBRC 14720 / NCIMB 2260 / Gabara) TaxID=348780 RepID=A0A1U7EW74_NATPD|nr:metalloregulator ArsR/SmtB family transcription factor [Natronomonas pharaonis]CAI49336.1 ArsR family transcription regulator [Natronomonas pharaonis DSM 2160]
MDSAALLDLLGNENRRRILRLLARRPCYVTEISDYLGVSPKAVIDHLRKLEEAGLVESHVDDGRRKYFSIARNLRLEVNVTPYDFGTKSAYSASPNLDITSWKHVSLHVERATQAAAELNSEEETEDTDIRTDAAGASDSPPADVADGASDSDSPGDADQPPNADLAGLAADLEQLERLENELSMAQRWVQGRLTETLDRISDHFDGVDGRFYAELLRGLATGPEPPDRLAQRVDAPPDVVADALEGLAAHGVVERDGDQWRLNV